MTLLYDDTQLLLAVDPSVDESSLDTALAGLSGTVITQLALRAKAEAYQARIDRSLAAAANLGAGLDELAAAAGMAPDDVLARLQVAPRGLVEPATRIRLGLDATRPTGARPTRAVTPDAAARRKPRRWRRG